MLSSMVKAKKTKVQTNNDCDVVDVTEQVNKAIKQSGISTGAVILYNGNGEHAH